MLKQRFPASCPTSMLSEAARRHAAGRGPPEPGIFSGLTRIQTTPEECRENSVHCKQVGYSTGHVSHRPSLPGWCQLLMLMLVIDISGDAIQGLYAEYIMQSQIAPCLVFRIVLYRYRIFASGLLGAATLMEGSDSRIKDVVMEVSTRRFVVAKVLKVSCFVHDRVDPRI
ncbi:hypothetical protein BGZ63DRAFT_102224 [Mariannaea sp. PMI_226]|nr:hypothetical protein BGZ63DRAFT_102224 [Mariannaea sp. PMI_226]